MSKLEDILDAQKGLEDLVGEEERKNKPDYPDYKPEKKPDYNPGSSPVYATKKPKNHEKDADDYISLSSVLRY